MTKVPHFNLGIKRHKYAEIHNLVTINAGESTCQVNKLAQNLPQQEEKQLKDQYLTCISSIHENWKLGSITKKTLIS